MKLLKQDTKGNSISVTINAELSEFHDALKHAYMDDTAHYPVPGHMPGMAPREEIEKLYGETALYDEAVGILIPQLFEKFLKDKNIRIFGRPQVSEITWDDDGSVRFTIESERFPQVKLGKYLGLEIPLKRDDDEFEEGVLNSAANEMKVEISDAMIEQQLDAQLAQEKLRVNQDAVYHLLADIIAILDSAYKETGVNRPMAQVRAEAADTMLQTISVESGEPSKEYIVEQIREHVKRYHDLPDDFNERLDSVFKKRGEKKSAMNPDEIAEEVFAAYLGSLGMDVNIWRTERKRQARAAVYHDLLLDAVADAENISVSRSELNEAINDIAGQCGMEFEEVIGEIDDRPIKDRILRDKARKLIVESAMAKG